MIRLIRPLEKMKIILMSLAFSCRPIVNKKNTHMIYEPI